ncbi:30S ribosomal protein S17e [Candidatus Woesearchaeota archaeon]|jgi:small subunit ribosomal protein S17e|nr:30S ribosomal protein S17e [Candidatus Woesearchaeota archaeon]MBT5272418.1 30S ribosomal protein S17e [Candidatus Woesearchaeota archaeon]MBT6041240.1 30S ribosomal protein S17e [Candidatus Woesearchaeota archaeon]MBT6337472.1 30S ribosomal protein S17e [Candidatus Woesearchaeota archaeon]MBT7928215.1 30S ribosomal protein S17e [Candidatus Woesearchaeota archaeon]
MGRIKTKLIKRIGSKLFKLHGDEFSNDYKKNKLKVAELAEIRSKKLKNIIAGYTTRLARSNK